MFGVIHQSFPRLIDILLVDDDESDVLLTRKSLEHGKVCNVLHVAKDGVEALAYLRRKDDFAARHGRVSFCSI